MKGKTILYAGLVALSLAGCGEKKTDSNIITKKVEARKPSSPIKMQDYSQKREFSLAGAQLVADIGRTADSSLDMVSDENGQKFIDNRITLIIKRSDGSVFFQKEFTKSVFEPYLDDDYMTTGVLEGLVFDRVDGNTVRFAASVSHPQTDEYIPLVVSISNTGAMTIARDTQLDTGANADEDI
ncbi:DUF4738 domain-containing protein [Xylanibacter muris]|uniref:DUF4738 domain-containing protein n=1 Tax=Xylanibacter muris TaxID=2736290 RepID=A0ABX2AQK2_9BACT|nr:DUF4738 domain-containing protein [Xylanibacter muris]NPD93249.1 DUF4738 domain-containing protein [Xylanibacter muris]